MTDPSPAPHPPVGGAPGGRPPGRPRRSPLRDYTVVLWFVAAAVVSLVHRWVPESTWFMVHLVVLGALTHSMLVWSRHFSRALLKTRHDGRDDRRQNARLLTLLVGSVAVFVGVPTSTWPLVVAGGAVVAAAVLWHGASLLAQLRRALPGRFRGTIRYYLAAAAWLPVGVTFGVLLARGLGEQWHARLLVAHTLTMLLGWVGLTVVGTLVTFWPTVLRARMDDRAESAAARVFVPLNVAVAVIAAAALAGWTAVAVTALAVYLVLVLWWGRTLLAPLRAKPPREFAPASIGAALVWFVVAAALTGWLVLTSDDGSIARNYPGLSVFWVGGFVLQLLTGALSYLLPAAIGGGPRVVRASARWFDRLAALRLTVINGGLLLWLLPLPSWARVVLSSTVMLAFLAFVLLMVRGIRAAVAERRRAAAGEPAAAFERPRALTRAGLTSGIAVLAVATALGLAVAQTLGASGAAETGTSSAVAATGETVEVTVQAKDMRFLPDTIHADAGDRVVVTVENADPEMVHDLTIAGQTTPRLDPGQSAVLDLGVVGASTQGWCSIVGHRQQGMVLDLVVAGAEGDDAGHGAHHAADDPAADPAAARTTYDPQTPLTRTVDATAPETPAEVDHRFTITTRDEDVEVAPGVWQTRWPFEGGPDGAPDPGGSLGPTIRGKVGDTFEVTFVNEGTMAHSIDFHASEVAPDEAMRSIAPGERLVYRFTANRSGAWLYHCGTMPMTAHIAAGMHGAVIIDPPDLEPVDREYVLVQSEVYVQPGTGESADAAAPVDAAGAQTWDPDMVVWNGIADQYAQRPLTARTGERVRFWVVAAGPNQGTSFHIVGAQFDTVYAEGAYRLRRGRDAFGTENGGAQALDVAVAQGGFVETVFAEPGHYVMVDHAMVNAERGARGIVAVTD